MTDDTANPADNDSANTGNPTRKIALAIVALLIGIILWYGLSDRYAPTTSRGFVMAHISQLAPRVSGRVTSVYVEDNATVTSGDALFDVDRRPFELAVEVAKLQLQQTAKSIGASSSSLEASQANVAQARVSLENTQQNTNRVRQLAQRGLVSEQQLDSAETALKASEAALSAAIAQSDASAKQLGDTGEDNTQIKTAKVHLEQAEYDLLSTQVTAPNDGVVTNVRLSTGQFAAAGRPQLTFIESGNYWISAQYRENQLVNVNSGDAVSVIFDAIPGKVFKAKVASVGWGINPGVREAGGLMVNQRANQWFEPARRMPVHIELLDGETWPQQARVGGKVNVIVYSSGRYNPIALLGGLFHRMQSWLTVFY